MRWNFRQKKIAARHADEPAYRNPLFTKPNWQLFVIERLGLFGWLIVFLFVSTIYLIFYSPLLQITTVEISGTKTISPQMLNEKFVSWQLEQARYKIFKQNNIFMFSKKWLQENIGKQYDFAALTIDKKLPHTLRITITEKKPALGWVVNGVQYYLGESGEIASLMDGSDQTNAVPLIYDDSNTTVTVGQIILNRDKVFFIEGLLKQISQLKSIEVVSYHMLNNLNPQLNVRTKADYTIYFDTAKGLDVQLTKLKRILADETLTSKPPKEYIDVRLGDRVYYK